MMNQEALQVIIDKTHALMNAHSCCKEAKAAAQAWLDAIGTENEAEAAKMCIRDRIVAFLALSCLIVLSFYWNA